MSGKKVFTHAGELLANFFSTKRKRLSWYEELPLKNNQIFFLKKLLRLEEPYKTIEEISTDFINFFYIK